MRFDLKNPCSNCPYTRGKNAVRLIKARTSKLIDIMTVEPGATFTCHKTVDYDDQSVTGDEQHCVGALIFAEKQGRFTNIIRIAGRLGLFNPSEFSGHERVFDDADEMLESALGKLK